MKSTLKWIAFIAIALIAVLAWVAHEAIERYEELSNRIRTAPARAARHPQTQNNEQENDSNNAQPASAEGSADQQ